MATPEDRLAALQHELQQERHRQQALESELEQLRIIAAIGAPPASPPPPAPPDEDDQQQQQQQQHYEPSLQQPSQYSNQPDLYADIPRYSHDTMQSLTRYRSLNVDLVRDDRSHFRVPNDEYDQYTSS